MRRILSRMIMPTIILALVLVMFSANSVIVYAAASITLGRISGPVGSYVTVTGSGFGNGETGIKITWDGTDVTTGTGITAGSSGSWTSSFVVPVSAFGYHTVSAYGAINGVGTVPGVQFMVTNPNITINRTSGPPGSYVTVTGSGFAASETGITITYDGTAIASVGSADSQGAWSSTFAIPASVYGTHTISAYGPTTLAGSIPGITFTVTPGITISRTSGPPGSYITVIGSGFGYAETGITITYDGNPVISNITANAQGAWSGTMSIPASSSGSHTIGAYGSTTQATSVAGVTFTIGSGITISRTSGAPGSSVTVTGSGFGASETGITITYDGNPVGSSISANSQGAWSGTFTVPASASGSHTIGAYGSTTQATSVAGVAFTIGSGITINRASGPVGSSITVTGSGFSASETGITITYDGNAVTSGISANSQGAWSGTIAIPGSASGSHTINAHGPVTLAGSTSNVTFMVIPTIAISRTSGTPGSSVTVTGSGFSASETGITITYDGTPVVLGISADSLGNWSAAFAIPASASGSHSVKAYGSATQGSSVSGTNLSITPSVSISPASGYVGGTVKITGSGFAANSPLTFTYDAKEIPAEGVTTDAGGSFSKSFIIPKSKAGNHTIAVVDSQKNESKVSFAIDSTPPPAPNPLSPQDGARLSIVGDITPTLTWSNVTSPSGVTYILQVDTSPDFSQPILEKTDISGNRYIFMPAEALSYGEYYWRVKAVDGASNESAWSQPRLLNSGVMPLWTLVTLIAVVVASVSLGIYFALVRPRARRREAIVIPEVEMPQVSPGQWRTIESEEAARERQLPWRLSLPEPTKGAKTVSTEDQARLKVITDFAQSLPLVEPGYNVNWLVDLVETGMGIQMSAPVYEQLLKGELQVRYEPAWTHHPAFQDLTTLLEKQPILQELNAFIDTVERCASEAISLLQDIYRDAVTEVPPDFLEKGGWGFISAIYADAMSWFLGKSLRDPSERDYTLKPRGGADEGGEEGWLYGEETTSFAGQLILAPDEKEALRFRALHLRLRRSWRNNNRAKQLTAMLTQLEMQRSRLLNVFSQFGRLKR